MRQRTSSVTWTEQNRLLHTQLSSLAEQHAAGQEQAVLQVSMPHLHNMGDFATAYIT